MDKLILNGKTISFDEIIHGPAEQLAQDNFDAEVLKFIRSWHSGQQTFTITTSGSTGTPKPFEITRKQMQASAAMTIKALGLQPEDTALLCLDPAYIAGKMMIVRALEGNMQLVAVHPDANPLKALPRKTAIDFTALVPYQLKTILQDKGGSLEKLNNMKAILLGGAPVDQELEDSIQEIEAPVYATFAMTETVSHFALRRLNGPTKSPYFQVLENISISCDDHGCLCVTGPVTNHNIVVTNDLIDPIDEQHFLWLGRADNIINSGGVKIYPEALEPKIASILKMLHITAPFFLWGFPSKKFGQEPGLVIESTPINDSENILHALKEKLPKYQAPRSIHFVEKFVYTKTNKIQRQMTVDKLYLQADRANSLNTSK